MDVLYRNQIQMWSFSDHVHSVFSFPVILYHFLILSETEERFQNLVGNKSLDLSVLTQEKLPHSWEFCLSTARSLP